jgi:hypothetical protein
MHIQGSKDTFRTNCITPEKIAKYAHPTISEPNVAYALVAASFSVWDHGLGLKNHACWPSRIMHPKWVQPTPVRNRRGTRHIAGLSSRFMICFHPVSPSPSQALDSGGHDMVIKTSSTMSMMCGTIFVHSRTLSWLRVVFAFIISGVVQAIVSQGSSPVPLASDLLTSRDLTNPTDFGWIKKWAAIGDSFTAGKSTCAWFYSDALPKRSRNSRNNTFYTGMFLNGVLYLQE